MNEYATYPAHLTLGDLSTLGTFREYLVYKVHINYMQSFRYSSSAKTAHIQ